VVPVIVDDISKVRGSGRGEKSRPGTDNHAEAKFVVAQQPGLGVIRDGDPRSACTFNAVVFGPVVVGRRRNGDEMFAQQGGQAVREGKMRGVGGRSGRSG